MASKFAKFAISTADLPEDFGKPVAREESKPKNWTFKPGLHENLVIESAELMEEPCKGDPTWLKCKLSFRKGNSVIRNLVLVPTQKLTYTKVDRDEEGNVISTGNPTNNCFENLARFLLALGVELNKDTAGDVIPAVFGNPELLVGMRVNAQIGHSGYYAHYISKEEYHLYSKYDKPVCNKGTSNPIQFPAPEAAEHYCTETLKEQFSCWAEIKKFAVPTEANTKQLPTKPLEEKKAKAAKAVAW